MVAFALFASAWSCFDGMDVRGVPTTPVLGPPGAVDGSDILGIRRFRFRKAGFANPRSPAALVDARGLQPEDGRSDFLDSESGPCLRICGLGMAGLASISGGPSSHRGPTATAGGVVGLGAVGDIRRIRRMASDLCADPGRHALGCSD